MSEARVATPLWLPLLSSIVGSVVGTLITNALASNPTLNMVALVVGAAVPPLIGTARSYWHLGAWVSAVIIVGIVVTYAGFFTVDAVKGVPGATVPDPISAAGIQVDPAAVTCGVATCPDVTVHSTGAGPLHITGVAIEDDPAGSLAADTACVDQSLPAGETCVIRMTRTGSEPRDEVRARLMIHQNVPGPPTSIEVMVPRIADTGSVVEDGVLRAWEGDLGIQVSPVPLRCDAGGCPVVTVTSTRADLLRVTEVQIEGDPTGALAVDQVCVGTSLSNGRSCEITVSRTGVVIAGDLQAKLVIHQNFAGPATSVDVTVAGDGILEQREDDLGIRVSPVPVVCTADDCPVVHVESIGTRALKVTRMEIANDPTGVLSVDQVCAGQSLDTGETCQITLTRSDVAADETVHPQLVIHQNFRGDPTFVDVRVEPGPGPDFTLTPDPVECSAEGCPAVTASNSGSEPVSITAVEIEGDTSGVLSPDQSCVGTSIGAGESCDITISLSGAAVGDGFQARIVVHHGPDGSTTSVRLTVTPDTPLPTYDLVASNSVTCNSVPGSTPGEAGQLNVVFGLTAVGGDPSNAPGAVPVRGSSDSGLFTEYTEVPGAETTSVAKFAIDNSDLGRTHRIEITVDPDEVIAETDETNNTVHAVVDLPADGSATGPTPCDA